VEAGFELKKACLWRYLRSKDRAGSGHEFLGTSAVPVTEASLESGDAGRLDEC